MIPVQIPTSTKLPFMHTNVTIPTLIIAITTALIISQLTLIFLGYMNTTHVAVNSIAWYIDTTNIDIIIIGLGESFPISIAVTIFDIPMTI